MSKHNEADIISIVKNMGKQEDDVFPERMSLEELKEIWNDEHGSLTDEELLKVREWLYVVTSIIIKVIKEQGKQTPVIDLQSENYENKQSNSLCQSEYRRTG
jgi:hypothetical protein